MIILSWESGTHVLNTKFNVMFSVVGADPGGRGHGGSCPPSSGVYDVTLPWPRPSYYIHAHARLNSRSLVLPRQLQTTFFLDPWLHDGAYLAQRLLAQGCSLIASSRDRGCYLAMNSTLYCQSQRMWFR